MRGDSYSMPIKINVGTKLKPEYYFIDKNDSVYFGVCEPNQSFEEAVIKKKLDYYSEKDSDGHLILNIEPKDTLNLFVGKYYYQIKLRTIDDKGIERVKTIVSPTQFFIDGNNVSPQDDQRYEVGKYNITDIILEGGGVGDSTHDEIVFEGGVIK